MRRTTSLVLAAGLLLGGCSDEPEVGFEGLPEAEEGESVTPAPSPSASAGAPDEIDVTTTPDEVTPEWVTAVVNTLLNEYGEMTAEVLAMPVQDDPTLPDGFDDRLDDLFGGQYRDFAASELAALLVDVDGRRDPLHAPDDYRGLEFAAQLVQVADTSCVVAVGRLDRSRTRIDGDVSPGLSAVALGPASGDVPWRLHDLLPNNDSQGAPNPDEAMFEADLEDYGAALDHTCQTDR